MHYSEVEKVVKEVLNCKDAADGELDAALEIFLSSREDRREQHGFWVHSLSHFSGKLWERRLIDWIKRFNEVAFRGAAELGDFNCVDRLVDDFMEHARWDDNPADFHLSLDMELPHDSLNRFAEARIAAGAFESEAAALRFELRHAADRFKRWDSACQCDLLSVDQLQAVVQRLKELGEDVGDLVKRLVAKQLNELEAELAQKRARNAPEWKIEELEKGVEKSRAQLNAL